MSKNEYRRAFIMLRPAATGYSGHVRLERRTMTGSMYFIVSAPEGRLRAALVGQRGGDYYAAPLGTFRRDDRGQLTLAWAFDPRAIDGRPLEAYQLIAVAETGGSDCRVVLTGNVDGAYPMDAASVKSAVCGLFRPETPAADLPAPEEPLSAPETASEEMNVSEGIFTAEGTFTEEGTFPAEVTLATGETFAGENALESEPAAETLCDPAPEPQAEPAPESARDNPETEAVISESAAPEPEPVRTKIYTRMRTPEVKAEEPPTLMPSIPASEPEAVLPGDAPRPEATPCTMPLEDGYSYIRAPLPAVCGLGWCLLGVRIEDGRAVSMRCAVPGAYAPQPPEGLEDGVWVGTCDGSGSGYWVTTVSVTG